MSNPIDVILCSLCSNNGTCTHKNKCKLLDMKKQSLREAIEENNEITRGALKSYYEEDDKVSRNIIDDCFNHINKQALARLFGEGK